MDQLLNGKVAVITGGANGLGQATAELFAKAGAKVVIGDLDATAGEAVAKGIGETCRFQRTDVSKPEELQALCDLAVSAFGGLDIMCNNAAVPNRMVRLLDDDLDAFDRVFDVNVRAVIRGTQIAGRYMRDHGGGVILNTSSIAGIVASFGVTSYRASKAAVIHASKNAAIELAGYGIRVNCLVPGQIETKLIKDALAANTDPVLLDKLEMAIRDVMDSYQPLRRRGMPEDVAQAALFLASDNARYITGVVLPIDGGITAGDAHNYIEKFDEARRRVMAEAGVSE